MHWSTTHMNGLFDLLSFDDLCAKLEHDYRRISANPADVFAAFDFFVTAWHMLEWKYPGSSAKIQRETVAKQYPILAVLEHLAVGGKHFQPTNPKLVSVKKTRRDSAWARGLWAPGLWGPGVWKDDLVVDLDGDAKATFGPTLNVKQIADLTMTYWRGPGGCPKATGVGGSSI